MSVLTSRQPLLHYFMDLAVRGLALPNGEEMREYTYSFFANVAEAYKVSRTFECG